MTVRHRSIRHHDEEFAMSSDLHPFNRNDTEEPVPAAIIVAEATFRLSVQATRTETTGEVTVTGSGATGESVEIHYMHVPGAPVNIQSVAGVQDGSFSDAQHWPLSYGSQQDADADVYVMARDPKSGAVDVQSVKAGLWIIVS
jgi:hypothetical protein